MKHDRHTETTDPIERQARRRVALRLGWLAHAAVFVLVNGLLGLRAAAAGTGWGHLPLAGWGVALCLHGLAVLMAGWGQALHARLLEGERRRLMAGRDPW